MINIFDDYSVLKKAFDQLEYDGWSDEVLFKDHLAEARAKVKENKEFKDLFDEDNVDVYEIYGKGGWHRYHIWLDGKITFSSLHAMEEDTQKARELGFDII